MRAVRAWTILGMVAVAVATARLLPSCGTSFTPPCTSTRVVVVPAEQLPSAGGSVSLTERSDGSVVVVGLVPPVVDPDAGASFAAPAARIVLAAAGPGSTGTFDVPPPGALRARRGSTTTVGASFVADRSALFHWIETAVTTDPDGAPRTTSRLVLQRATADGTEAPAATDPALTCTRCTLAATFASADRTTAAIVQVVPDPPGPPGDGRTFLVVFDDDGHVVATRSLDGLAPPSGLGGAGPPARLSVQRGLFLARVARTASLFDASLAPRGGPFGIETLEAELDRDPSGRLTVVFSKAATLEDAGAFVGQVPDLIIESRGPDGDLLGAPRRLTDSSTAIALRRSGTRTGVVHSVGPIPYFSIAGDDGVKIGGDLPLGIAASGDQNPALAAADRGVPSVILGIPDDTHFHFWSANADVTLEVVTCAP